MPLMLCMQRHIGLVLTALALSACGPATEARDPSDGWGDLASPKPPSKRVRAPQENGVIVKSKRQMWPYVQAFSTLKPVGSRGPSEHLGGDYERSVRINSQAAAYRRLRGIAMTFPDGAILVQAHHPTGSPQILSYFAMRKEHGRWNFWILDPQLRVAATPQATRCSRCHVQSPQDAVFGPPESGN